MSNYEKYDIQTCYCKNNYFYNRYNETLFCEGKYYKYFFESTGTVWVIYDQYGESSRQGIRFHSNKNIDKESNLDLFYKYFDCGRLMKLKKLENIQKEKEHFRNENLYQNR